MGSCWVRLLVICGLVTTSTSCHITHLIDSWHKVCIIMALNIQLANSSAKYQKPFVPFWQTLEGSFVKLLIAWLILLNLPNNDHYYNDKIENLNRNNLQTVNNITSQVRRKLPSCCLPPTVTISLKKKMPAWLHIDLLQKQRFTESVLKHCCL